MKEKQESMYTFVNDLSNNEITIKQANSLLNKKDALYPVYKKILDLLENINDSHLRNNKIMEEKKAIEIKYLQSKFNPHLLYNTLSVLKWKCIKYDKTLAAAAEAIFKVSSIEVPLLIIAAKYPVKVSPAPVVSTGSALKDGCFTVSVPPL